MSDPSPSTRWTPQDTVFGQCRLGLEDFVQAIREEPRTRGLIRLAMTSSVGLCAAGAWLTSTERRGLGLGLLVSGLALFAAYHAPERIAERWFSRTPPQARRVRYTLSPHGLIVASELSNEVHAWSSLRGYEQVSHGFLIWVSTRLFVIVPKRAFAPADLPRVIAQLERQLGAPPRLPPFWPRLALACVLAVLALLLWNQLSPR